MDENVADLTETNRRLASVPEVMVEIEAQRCAERCERRLRRALP
jgi:hypothetical protein